MSRLAVSEAARQLADTATALVPTGTDASARADEVRLAHQLVDQARDVLDRAVIHARERGVSWEAIGDVHGGITRQSAQRRYAPAVAAFNDALDQPWARSRRILASRLPNGAGQPGQTAARLDTGCAQHTPETSIARAHAETDDAGMVSAHLPTHNDVTRMTAVVCYGEALRAREQAGETVPTADWDWFATAEHDAFRRTPNADD